MSTRSIVMFNRVSADGYFADADGGLDWAVPDDELDRGAAENMPGADTILFGRRTYDAFESFWPQALKQAAASGSAADPHAKGRSSAAMGSMARWINEAQKLVFSTTRKRLSWHNSRALATFDPAEIRSLKEQPGKAIMVFGSGTIVSLLSQHGLIDEYQLVVNPLLLGDGNCMIKGLTRSVPLSLIEAKGYASGCVMLRYRPQQSSQ